MGESSMLKITTEWCSGRIWNETYMNRKSDALPIVPPSHPVSYGLCHNASISGKGLFCKPTQIGPCQIRCLWMWPQHTMNHIIDMPI